MIQNVIQFGGKYIREDELSAGQKERISQELLTRLAAEFGYAPYTKEGKKSSTMLQERSTKNEQ